ncbi:hypothetical protein ACFVWN_09465 [Nocardiopsis flavescens]|uniref:hypothetical protein n=1 Tax=Nocardiopsis flavescens TaxID=758803 RepID=UPI003650D638
MRAVAGGERRRGGGPDPGSGALGLRGLAEPGAGFAVNIALCAPVYGGVVLLVLRL